MDHLMDSARRHANGNYWLGLIMGLVMASLIAIALNKMSAGPVAEVQMPQTVIEAYNLGLKDALKTNPASWDLEQTCLNMWADKQPVR
jgi:hypothetical protein